MEAIGEAGTPKHKIAVLAEKTGGIFSFIDTGGGLPLESPDVSMLLMPIYLGVMV